MPSFPRIRSSARVLAVLLASLPALGHADAITDKAKALIDGGQSQAAYDLLIPLESDRAGDETYDLLLGIAAADVGRNTNAVLALERALAINPNNARARAEIARAYFALGETRAARQEFEAVKQQGVPAEVQRTIDKFLSAVERVDDEGKTTLRGYVEGTLGYDRNPGAATALSQVAVPALGGVINLTNTKQSDAFYSFAGGLNLRKPIDPRLAFVAGVSGTQRRNEDLNGFNTSSWEANAGLNYKEDKEIFSVLLQTNQVFLASQRYRETWGATGQWQHNYDQRNQATLFVQYADMRYPRDQYQNRKLDADRWIAGAGYAHALRDMRTVVFGSAYAGFENTRSQLNADRDYNVFGLRGGGQYQIRDGLSVFANASVETRSYQGPDNVFTVTRGDESFTAGLGVSWSPAKDWKVTPQWQYSATRSNVNINTNHRNVYSATARYDF